MNDRASGDGDRLTENLPRSREYALHRAPDLMTVTPGARVRYTCDHRNGRPPQVIGGTSSYRDGVRWYKFRERALLEETRGSDPGWAVPLEKGPVGDFAWECRWNDEPGRYVVGAEISDGRESTFCFLPQYVETAGLVVGRSLDDLLRTGIGPSPAEAERAVARHLANVQAIEKRFPIASPQDKRRHDETVNRWKKHQQALRDLLAPTDGKRRIAVPAMHVETTTQARRPLLLFLCHVDHATVGRAGRKRPRWVLVDWTDPTDTRFHGSYQGDGDTDAEAIRNALADWDWGNRYPAGELSYELPSDAFGRAQRYRLTTNGKSFGDEIKGLFEWVAIGGLLVAGALLIFTPVPALAAGALGTSLLSSTAAAGISIGQRWRAGIFDWQEDAFDGLTIIGNLFAGAGAWARGARVVLRGKSGERMVRIFIGAQVGTDLVQGVLVAEEALEKWTDLTENPDLLPEDRARKLLEFFRRLALSGLLTYVSLRGSASELDNLNKKPRHLANEGPARTPADKLADLAKPDRTVDTTKPPITEGHTREGKQTTTVKVGVAVHPRTIHPPQTEFAALYSRKTHPWRKRTIEKSLIWLIDKDGFAFKAKCREGTLEITIVTKVDPARTDPYILGFFDGLTEKKSSEVLVARDLYPRMYKYFEEVGNPVKKLKGPWAWDNYADAKAEFDKLVKGGFSEDEAAKMAVLHARSYRFHKAQGLDVVIWARHDAHAKQLDFEIERSAK